MGRRTLAWLADLVLYLAVITAGFASMAEYTEIPAGIAEEDACALLEQQNPGSVDGCIAFDGDIYLLDTGETGLQTLLSLGWFVFFVVLQGATGGSPGKLLFGLRVVDQYGTRAGIAKSLGRTLMWVIDAAPWIIPLVGPITGLTSTGHRRVGDMAAGTYVVARSSVGAPVVPAAGVAPPPGQTAWGAPPPTAPPPPGQAWAPPTAGPPPGPSRLAGNPGESGRWTPPVEPEEHDLDIRDLEVPHPTERSDIATPTVDADPEWSRTPDLDVTPPPAVQDLHRQAEDDAAAAAPPEWEPPTLPDVADPIDDWQPPTTPGPDPTSSGDPSVDPSPGAEPSSSEPPTSGPDTGGPHNTPDPTPAARAEPAPFIAPGAEPGAPTGPPTASADHAPAPHELPPPQWDTARNTYIQWDPNRQAWLEWDTPGNRWKPIDT